MLIQLTLQNLALMEYAEIQMHQGFNVITGETGAGKSLLLDALQLCVGGRTDVSLIRHGKSSAEIFAEFDICQLPDVQAWLQTQNYKIDDNCLLIRRQLSQQNKTVRSKAWLNGSPISINELKILGNLLVNIHSQHAQHSLLQPQFVTKWLDSATGLTSLATSVYQAFLHYEKLKSQAKHHAKDEQFRLQQIQLLENQLADIEPISQINYKQIEAEYDELSNLENLMQQASVSLQLLDNDNGEPAIMSLLGRVIKLCENQASLSQTYADCTERLYEAQSILSEVSSNLADYGERQSLDPERLAILDEQLSTFHRLARKYQTTPEQLLANSNDWQAQLDKLTAVISPKAMAEEVNQAYQNYLTLAKQLDDARKQHAKKLATVLMERLKPLALLNVQAKFCFETLEKPQSFGLSNIELLFSANVGMPLQPIHKIASGGELSRLALIMQVIDAQGICRKQQNHTNNCLSTKQLLVFDEVDVGISGGTAQILGELLRQLGKEQQIIAITHQAQVASMAHQHILVYKTQENQAKSHLQIIQDDAQVHELARMSGGINITKTTLEHARSLLANQQVVS
ncbi:DNA repair protein RecN [Moraxella macacae 0408225]|uniref:DNA repair protein RecN n=1 Tax=Moraxella macacae 0408225 TaxID=1230338 RepID=L2F9T0_9GAMM|nr:DNA repair protein RecN [Moraxella macacae]ELA09228.1 DNA repair protein RecN [Moraxella macacae 0408225]